MDCATDGAGGVSTVDIPGYFLFCLTDTYTAGQLREFLHTAELELFAADYWDDPTAGWWQEMCETYRQALAQRREIDAKLAAKPRATRRTKRAPVDIAELKERIDIVEHVGRYVTLKKEGRNYVGSCPFHHEKTPSFKVFPDRKGWVCFGCGAKGDIVTFYRLIHGDR